MKWVLYFVAFGTVIYFLYDRGLLVTKHITAVLFTMWVGKSEDNVALNSCTGWVRHRVRFRGSGMYTFTMDHRLSKGDVTVSLLDSDKRELLRLDRELCTGSAELSRRSRYYLRWDIRSATGTCALCWRSDSMD